MTATDVASTPQVQDAKASSSKEASPVKTTRSPNEVLEEATTLLSTGKRNMLVNDVPAAVSSLAKACELVSGQFGETANECAEPYFYYGKALLELSRMESGVLGNALDGVPEEEGEGNDSKIEDPEKLSEEEKKTVESKVSDAFDENSETLEKAEEVKEALELNTEAIDTPKEDEVESMDEGNTESESEDVDKENVGGTDKEGEKEAKADAEEEEPSNLQLAWEMLEMAKIVYSKQIEVGSDASKKPELEERLCSTILLLGEVSIENENYKQAVDDIKTCLEKQVNMPKDSRLRAETHYQLGVALGFSGLFDEAVESLNSAVAVIKERIERLKKADGTDQVKKELSELEALIPEIAEKISDTKDMKKESASRPEDKQEFEARKSGDDKPISSIAVKRKVDDEAKVSPNKKLATEKGEVSAAAV